METMSKSSSFQCSNDLKWEKVGPGISRQIMGFDEEIMMVKVHFDVGANGKPHKHPHRQSSYVISGKFEVTINGNKQVLSTGEGFFVEPDVMHSAVCLSSGELLDVFSPMREDFI